jgi:hypothetical protein
MGKMIDAQSNIVACETLGEEGSEGDLCGAAPSHSIVVAVLAGMIEIFFQPWDKLRFRQSASGRTGSRQLTMSWKARV